MTEQIAIDTDNVPPPVGPPATKVQRVSEYAGSLFEKAFADYGQGEQVTWDVTIQALPGPPPDGAPVDPRTGQPPFSWNTMLIVYAEIPGIVVGTSIFHSFDVPPHAWDEKKAAGVVRNIMQVLLAGRARQLDEMRQASTGPGATRTSGLIVPG